MLRFSVTALAIAPAAWAAPTFFALPASNGRASAVLDVQRAMLTHFLPHPYAAFDDGIITPQLAYDAFFGVRAAGRNAWLAGAPVAEAGYVAGTAVARVAQRAGALWVETYLVAPRALTRAGILLVARVKNETGSPVADTALFALANFHVGSGPSDTAAETIAWLAGDGAFVESGARGTLVYRPLVPAARHARSPANPYTTVNAGATLTDADGTATLDDAVAGFQFELAPGGVLGPGEAAYAGFAVLAAEDSTAAALTELAAYSRGRGPADLLLAEIAADRALLARARLPASLSATERSVAERSILILLQAQVAEQTPDGPSPHGQLLAALPPGAWNIAWPRDAAYAAAALARSGYAVEARAAVDFALRAAVGEYLPYVGLDYGVSICRHYGRGREWSDVDANGPNIEFDNLGLTLWALAEADGAALAAIRRERVFDRTADVLIALTDPSGLLPPDSSIWERHWNGNQKRFAYSSIAAAAGLCAAAAVAPDAASAARYRAGARRLRDGVLGRLTDAKGALASSAEELARGSGYRDAAVIEAVNFGLVAPTSAASRATLALIEGLRVAPDRGFRRNDDGDWYDRQEWAFIDLRVATALFAAERAAEGGALLDRITTAAAENAGLIPELFDEVTGAYAGAVPMAGFGAGAYLLALEARATGPRQDSEFCPEPVAPDAGSPPPADAGVAPDGGGGRPAMRGCGCTANSGAAAMIGGVAAAARRRRLRSRVKHVG